MNRSKRQSEEGFALLAVMGAIALITVVAVAGFAIAMQAQNESLRTGKESRAYQAASSGLEIEMSTFSPTKLAAGSYPTPEKQINGVDVYSADVQPVAGQADTYEMIVLGRSAGTTETVRQRFQHFDLWDMNIAGADNNNLGGGSGLNGNGRIIGKVYVNGDFNWTGNGSLEAGPVFVRQGEFYKQSDGSNVGLPTELIDLYLDRPPAGPGVDTSMYTQTKGNPPVLQLPWLEQQDMVNYLNMAITESTDKVGEPTGTRITNAGANVPYYKVVDNDNPPVLDGDTDVTIGDVNFGTPGALGDDFAVADDPGSGGKALWINGVVSIDGTVTFTPDIKAYYGKGIIAATNGFVLSNGTKLRPAASIPGHPSYNASFQDAYGAKVGTGYCLGLVTMGGVEQYGGLNPATPPDYDLVGAVFANGKYLAHDTGAGFRGSIIAGGIDFAQPNSVLVTISGLRTYLPQGMPGIDGVNARGDWLRN